MLTARTADYLETIYVLSLANDTVGVSQVAAERSVTIPTARSAIVRLRDEGLVRQERYGKILLTTSGRKRAESVYRTHKAMFRFLHDLLGVDSETADSEACRLEHGLSEDTRARLVDFLDRQDSDDCGCHGGGSECPNEGCACPNDGDEREDE